MVKSSMALAAGDKLGPYEILALIGAGGMGEVYRARDPRLNREVAVKVSQEEFSERFEREARAVAALNHPNVCTLHDVGPNYLVMEFVEGETLAERVKAGPIPLDEALRLAHQIIDGMEAAHEKGIIHRDLKPANIKIRPDGSLKILDFGLAKVAPAPGAGNSAPSPNSPTLTIGMSEAGMILGTAAYMAPEQAKGKSVDKRADIWAFAVVVHEMVTAEHLFKGDDIGDTLAAVIMKEPDFSAAPRRLYRLLQRCLEKDPRRRLRDIGDARMLLEEPLTETPTVVKVPAPRSRLPWAVAAVMALAFAAIALLYFRQTPPPERILRYTVSAPEGSRVHSFSISPDGRLLAIAATVNGKRQLWLRPLDVLQAQAMPTTEDATYPFWSPDSRYIGFFAQDKLKKVAAGGGPAQSLCDVEVGRGGSWNRDNVILFSPSGRRPEGIQRVPAAGGVPVDVFKAKGAFRYPMFLPDGRHFLYMDSQLTGKGGIYISSLDGNENRRILPDLSNAVFAPREPESRVGHLLFVRENNLMAVPFDAERGQVSGDVFPAAEGVSRGSTVDSEYAPMTVSGDGVLLYGSGFNTSVANQLVWYDRTGKLLGALSAPGNVLVPAISPDEKVVAYFRSGGTAIDGDIWLRDLARATDTRFTTEGANFAPFWSPKGDRIVFSSIRGASVPALYQKASSGSGRDELLFPPTNDRANQWSRDGRFIVFSRTDPKTKEDLWYLSLNESAPGVKKPAPFLQTEFNELHGQLSPDSRWMAYTSDESGQREVYVRPFPPGEGKRKVSTAGGDQPRWRGDGKELFYAAADGKITAVPVKVTLGPKPSFEPGVPAPLFESHILPSAAATSMVFQYDVTADGKRFLVVTTGGAAATPSPPLNVVVNWNAGLKK